MLYTWDDPSRERCLLWNVVNVYDKKCKGFVADFWKVRQTFEKKEVLKNSLTIRY